MGAVGRSRCGRVGRGCCCGRGGRRRRRRRGRRPFGPTVAVSSRVRVGCQSGHRHARTVTRSALQTAPTARGSPPRQRLVRLQVRAHAHKIQIQTAIRRNGDLLIANLLRDLLIDAAWWRSSWSVRGGPASAAARCSIPFSAAPRTPCRESMAFSSEKFF